MNESIVFRSALFVLFSIAAALPCVAEGPEASRLAAKALDAAGGKDKVFKRYRFVDRLRVTKDEDALFKPLDDRKPRISIVDAPKLWWLKKTTWAERGKEPAKWLAYGWTLAVLDDPQASIEMLPVLTDPETESEAVGLRVTGAVEPAMDLYFDRESMLIVRLDWNKQICRFSDWKRFDGFLLPTRCVGYLRKSGKPWYACRIDDVERLSEIPKEVLAQAE